MQYKALVLASMASLALAQGTSSSAAARPSSTSASTCAAQNILDACISTTKGQVNGCAGNDWDCLCTAYGVVLTCYNNCPADPAVFGVQQQRDQYCNAASAYGTKTASKVASATSAMSATAASQTGTATRTSSTASATGNAASSLQISGGMLAVALAGFGLIA